MASMSRIVSQPTAHNIFNRMCCRMTWFRDVHGLLLLIKMNIRSILFANAVAYAVAGMKNNDEGG